MTARRTAAVLLLACACVVDEPAPTPWPARGGVDAFVARAQPVLAARCASPSCHGDPARPLALYAVHRHRLDPADTYLDAPLTEAELERNFRRAAGFLLEVEAAEDSPLLARPLAVAAGGDGHSFGAIFADTADPDYRALHAWALTALGR